MRCEDFESRLNEVLDERQTPSSAPDMEEHIRQCGNCRELAGAYEAVLAGARSAVVPSTSEWLTARIVERACSTVRPGDKVIERADRPSRFTRSAVLALAASLLMAVGGFTRFFEARRGRDGELGRQLAALDAQAQRSDADPAPALHQGNATAAAQSQAAQGAASAESSEPISSLPAATWAQPGAQWAQEVADGLQPVTRPTVGAINGFLNLWGVAGQGHRS